MRDTYEYKVWWRSIEDGDTVFNEKSFDSEGEAIDLCKKLVSEGFDPFIDFFRHCVEGHVHNMGSYCYDIDGSPSHPAPAWKQYPYTRKAPL